MTSSAPDMNSVAHININCTGNQANCMYNELTANAFVASEQVNQCYPDESLNYKNHTEKNHI